MFILLNVSFSKLCQDVRVTGIGGITVSAQCLGAQLWATAIGSGGYLFGCVFQVYLGKITHYEVRVFAIIALLGIFIWTVHFYHRRKHKP